MKLSIHTKETIVFGVSTLMLFLGVFGVVFGLSSARTKAAGTVRFREFWCATEVYVAGITANSSDLPKKSDVNNVPTSQWLGFSRSSDPATFDNDSPGNRCFDQKFTNDTNVSISGYINAGYKDVAGSQAGPELKELNNNLNLLMQIGGGKGSYEASAGGGGYVTRWFVQGDIE